MSLLTIIQQTAPLLGITAPVVVVGSTDLQVQQLFQLAQQEAGELARRHDWQVLVREQTFSASGDIDQPGAIPCDYDHMAAGQTFWNRSRRLPVPGPLLPDEWAAIRAMVATGPDANYRIVGNAIQFFPPAGNGEEIAYEYISQNWCKSAAGTPQSEWLADTDEAIIPERLIKLGIIWRWRQAKGFDYAEAMSTYEREVEKATARDRGPRTINTTRWWRSGVPQSWWPGVISVNS